MMKLLVFASLLTLFACTASNGKINQNAIGYDPISTEKNKIACFTSNSISIENDGLDVEVKTYTVKDDNGPEAYIFFDFDKMITWFYWSEESGEKGVLTDKLHKISDQLYYAKYIDEDLSDYTSFLFDEIKASGMLMEYGYTSYFVCEPGSVEELSVKYGFDYSPY